MSEESGSLSRTEAVGRKTSEIVDGSRIVTTVRTLGTRASTLVRESYCYRWLTKEPDPEVIVIDLRETWTVGPIIALLDRFVEWVAPYWASSTPKRALDELVALGERAAETRAGQLLGKLLAPPEPPESGQGVGDEGKSNTSDGDDPSEQADESAAET